MNHYLVYGLRVQTNIDFPQLLPDKDGGEDCDILIEVEESSENYQKTEGPLQEGIDFGNTGCGLWFKNQAGHFTIETKGDKSYMKCVKYADVHISIVRSFFLGNCIAILLTQRHKIVLHGSTLVMGNETFLICGDSGSGKSTLSMSMLDKGAELMADDISVIDVDPKTGKCLAYPGFPEQKLCRDAAVAEGLDLDSLRYVNEDRDKFSVDRNDIFVTEPREVTKLFALHKIRKENADENSFNGGFRAEEITGGQKVNAITDRFFLEQLYGNMMGLAPADMLKCVVLAGQIRIFDMTRVDGVDSLKGLSDFVSDNLEI
jgi:hypothetical protein